MRKAAGPVFTVLIVILVAAVSILAFGLARESERYDRLYQDDFEEALQAAGFTGSNVLTVESGRGHDGSEYRVAVQLAADGESRAAYFRREAGQWTQPEGWAAQGQGSMIFDWSEWHTNGQSYYEYHTVYCAGNALGKIEIPNRMVPDYYTVNVQQQGAFYMLHFTAYGNDLPLLELSEILEYLVSAGSISDSVSE